jgi:hypothetical protein
VHRFVFQETLADQSTELKPASALTPKESWLKSQPQHAQQSDIKDVAP